MLTTCSTSRLAKSQQNGRTDAPLAGMQAFVSWLDFVHIVVLRAHFLVIPASKTVIG